jgi:hypothetical protein
LRAREHAISTTTTGNLTRFLKEYKEYAISLRSGRTPLQLSDDADLDLAMSIIRPPYFGGGPREERRRTLVLGELIVECAPRSSTPDVPAHCVESDFTTDNFRQARYVFRFMGTQSLEGVTILDDVKDLINTSIDSDHELGREPEARLVVIREALRRCGTYYSRFFEMIDNEQYTDADAGSTTDEDRDVVAVGSPQLLHRSALAHQIVAMDAATAAASPRPGLIRTPSAAYRQTEILESIEQLRLAMLHGPNE